MLVSRSTHRSFCKKCKLKNFANFTEKHLRQSLFSLKFQVLKPATLLKVLQHKCFSLKCAKFLTKPILKNDYFFSTFSLKNKFFLKMKAIKVKNDSRFQSFLRTICNPLRRATLKTAVQKYFSSNYVFYNSVRYPWKVCMKN